MAKIALVLFISFVVFMLTTDAFLVKRDTPETKNASQTIDEAIDQIKAGLENFAKNVQSNELVQNLTSVLKDLGDKTAKKAQELIDNAKSKTTN